MNSFEHPTSICLCVHADMTKLILNAFSFYFVIGHSVFDIGYSGLKLIAIGGGGHEPQLRVTSDQFDD